MKALLARISLQLAGKLPLVWNFRLARLLGKLAWHLDGKSRHYALINLKLCLPALDPQQREYIARESVCAMAQSLLEAPRLWNMDSKQLDALVMNPDWIAEILLAYEEGNGVIIASPHLGSWEFIGLVVGRRLDMTCLFRPPRMEQLTEMILEGRGTTGTTLVPTDASGIKALTRALKQGQVTGILPDQEPSDGNGLFANFFGQPAYTMPLMLKLAKKRRIPIFFVAVQRHSDKPGYFFHCHRGSDALYDLPVEQGCEEMNSELEALIRLFPEQYNWAYRRFRRHPDGINRYAGPS